MVLVIVLYKGFCISSIYGNAYHIKIANTAAIIETRKLYFNDFVFIFGLY